MEINEARKRGQPVKLQWVKLDVHMEATTILKNM
jgi:hypothetical protein